jgi:hypothetical protein
MPVVGTPRRFIEVKDMIVMAKNIVQASSFNCTLHASAFILVLERGPSTMQLTTIRPPSLADLVLLQGPAQWEFWDEDGIRMQMTDAKSMSSQASAVDDAKSNPKIMTYSHLVIAVQ